MSDAKKDRHKKSKLRRLELEQRRAKAYRRRQGLSRDEEEAELASYVRRFIAYWLDQFLYIVFFVFFNTVYFLFFGAQPKVAFFGALPMFIFGFGYIALRLSKRGQTFGCRKTKIVVISEDGKGFLSYKKATIRWGISAAVPTLAYFAVVTFSNSRGYILIGVLVNIILLFVVFIPILRTSDRQGLHDRFAGSVVVREMKF